jgi:hypothetical protein
MSAEKGVKRTLAFSAVFFVLTTLVFGGSWVAVNCDINNVVVTWQSWNLLNQGESLEAPVPIWRFWFITTESGPPLNPWVARLDLKFLYVVEKNGSWNIYDSVLNNLDALEAQHSSDPKVELVVTTNSSAYIFWHVDRVQQTKVFAHSSIWNGFTWEDVLVEKNVTTWTVTLFLEAKPIFQLENHSETVKIPLLVEEVGEYRNLPLGLTRIILALSDMWPIGLAICVVCLIFAFRSLMNYRRKEKLLSPEECDRELDEAERLKREREKQ